MNYVESLIQQLQLVTKNAASSFKEREDAAPLALEAVRYIENLFSDNSDGHDVAHSIRVCRNALLIAKGEPGCSIRLIMLASLLHDVDDHKLFRTENNANARTFLAGHGVGEEDVDKICEIINAVSFSKNRGKHPGTREGKIVQDADRLDAIGAIGIARTFAFGGKHETTMDSSIQHFHEKLLLLKDEMNTDTGKQIAEGRHRFMEQFLAEYDNEMNGKV